MLSDIRTTVVYHFDEKKVVSSLTVMCNGPCLLHDLLIYLFTSLITHLYIYFLNDFSSTLFYVRKGVKFHEFSPLVLNFSSIGSKEPIKKFFTKSFP